uniref:Uncharacterized protein n=1 Tax=Rhizophora mucronata TaxID=61149 RepID=A0A2P2PTV1_RHIMU
MNRLFSQTFWSKLVSCLVQSIYNKATTKIKISYVFLSVESH